MKPKTDLLWTGKKFKEFNIETGIPILGAIRNPRMRALAEKMKVGDSIVLPTEIKDQLRDAIRGIGFKPVQRMIDKNSHRIWKIKK